MPSATSPPPIHPAILAQRYRLDRRLAQGGMAEVWLGTDLSLSRQVAVKLLKPTLASDPVVAERFRREAVSVAQLNHPNIVAVYDAIEHEGRQAVVMQLVNGKSLRQLLDEQKRLSPDLTMHIGSCVAVALDAAHRAGLVHRDVKPGNILITPDGRVLLTDFGIAKGLESAGDDLTSDNVMMGTAKYLSPEQVRGRRLDGRADLYSLGLVLYECLAGRVPFLGQTDADTALARLQRDPTDITRLRPTLPYGLPEVIHRLLARKPEQRFSNGAALRSALNDIAARAKATPQPDSTGTPATPWMADRPASPVRPPSAQPPARSSAATPSFIRAERSRAQTPTTDRSPPSGPVPGRPAGAPLRVERDRTPPSSRRPSARPNRANEHRSGPSLAVVGILLLVAAVLVAVLWSALGDDDGRAAGTLPPTATTAAAQSAGPAVSPIPAAGRIERVSSYDPAGDGEENEELAAGLGAGTGSWNTVCYRDKYLNGKQGVGIVVTFDQPTTGALAIDIASPSWGARAYATAAESIPPRLTGWGTHVFSDSSAVAETVVVQLPTPVRHVLFSFREIGAGQGCSSTNPYRGSVSGLRLAGG